MHDYRSNTSEKAVRLEGHYRATLGRRKGRRSSHHPILVHVSAKTSKNRLGLRLSRVNSYNITVHNSYFEVDILLYFRVPGSTLQVSAVAGEHVLHRSCTAVQQQQQSSDTRHGQGFLA